jgi:hypothetical protein
MTPLTSWCALFRDGWWRGDNRGLVDSMTRRGKPARKMLYDTDGLLPKLTAAQTKLAALLAGVDASKDSAAVQAATTDLSAKIKAATTVTTGVSATVLA